MKKYYLYGIGMLLFSSTATAQLDENTPVDREKFPNFKPVFNPERSLLKKSKQSRALRQNRPVYVNNADTPYFPPIFNQDGGSCSSAASVAYMLTYELNSVRGTDASKDENMLPTHFTWSNYFSPGQGQNAIAAGNGVPNIIVYEGRTFSRLFGNQDWKDTDFGWMQGYDKWYSAMFNRTTHSANFPKGLNTEEGRELVKDWLWNHCGDSDFRAGGTVNVMLGITGSKDQQIPQTPTNKEAGVVGKWYIAEWSEKLDHQMTIVGYDDRIEFDLDGNGIAGEKDKDEVGAWIIANSWGAGWKNKGFIYCPYKNSYTYKNENGPGGWWFPEMHFVRKDYRPLRTMKITMEYSKRSEIALSAGISTDLKATTPEKTTGFKHFTYAGNGGNEVDGETPMLGKWLTGMNYAPMEFGYDLTDLSAEFDTRRALKYFFIIESKSTANGTGKIHSCSVIDYEFDKAGLEVPFDLSAEGVQVETQGNRTIISCIVPGEPLYAPRNLVRQESTLSWSAPATTPYELVRYNIYRADTLECTADAGTLTADIANPGSSYTVSAIYKLNTGEEIESNKSNRTLGSAVADPGRNYVLQSTNSGINIPDIFTKNRGAVTIEYWLKPSMLKNWNQHVGTGWGTFLLHANSDGSVSAGWANDGKNRVNTPAGTLKVNQWHHIAIVIGGNNLTLYINGQVAGTITGSSYSGLGGFGDLPIGGTGTNEGIDGSIDELRIWNEARTAEQIARYMNTSILVPSAESTLLAYYNMNTLPNIDGQKHVKDMAGDHDAPLMNSKISRVMDNSLVLSSGALTADFSLPDGPYYAGSPVQFTNQSSPNAVKWVWNAPDAGVKDLEATNPQLIFPKEGTFKVSLTVSASDGSSQVKEMDITIDKPAAPDASFTASASEISTGDRVTFHVSGYAEGCTYEWSIPGAEVEKVYTTNAGAVFTAAGTYTVTLKVTNSAGESTTDTRQVTVRNSAPQSAFRINPSVVLKDETTYLEDASKYAPTSWSWELSNPSNSMLMDGRNGSIEPKHTGVYDARLITRNEVGGDTAVQKRALVVCNADGGNGLRFGGGSEYVTFSHPFANNKVGNFTISYWLNPNANTQQCHQIGVSKETFLCTTNAFGALTVYVKGSSMTTEKNVVIPGEWHHYAIAYAAGYVSVFRDAELIVRTKVSAGNITASLDDFKIGGGEAPMNAVIDEFQIWSKTLSADKLLAYGNNPISDIAAAEAAGLRLYYNFNEVADNVADQSSNKNTGVRVGFGPAGDAWSATRGIFCMSETQAQDVTSEYLTNYKSPFLHTSVSTNPSDASRFQQLETGTEASSWILEGTVTDGEVTTGAYVDGGKSDGFAIMTKFFNFAESIADHKAYQKVTLPAGRYAFSLSANGSFDAGSSFLAVSEAESLPGTGSLATEALSYSPLSDSLLVFDIREETTVSLGMVVNLEGNKAIQIGSFKLMRSELDSYQANGATGIGSTPAAGELKVVIEQGAVRVETKRPARVTVVSAGGMTCYDRTVDGSRRIALPKGIYIVNGRKVSVY